MSQTDRRTDKQIIWHYIHGYDCFLSWWNLLPPYLLCLPGDNCKIHKRLMAVLDAKFKFNPKKTLNTLALWPISSFKVTIWELCWKTGTLLEIYSPNECRVLFFFWRNVWRWLIVDRAVNNWNFFLTDPTQKLSSYIETSKNIILQPKKMLGASKLEDFKT